MDALPAFINSDRVPGHVRFLRWRRVIDSREFVRCLLIEELSLGVCLLPVEASFSSALPVSPSILCTTSLSFPRFGGAAATDGLLKW